MVGRVTLHPVLGFGFGIQQVSGFGMWGLGCRGLDLGSDV